MADLVESHEVGHLVSERGMLYPAFPYPSTPTAPPDRAAYVVLPAECDDVLPSSHAVTLTV